MTLVEKLCLQWSEFQTNVTTSYRDVRKNANFSDVTLACEDGRRIEAHRIILSSSSEFFRELLHSSTSSLPTHPLVYMRALPYETLASVIDFIYHGEVEVEKVDLDTFLQVASELRVKGMTRPGLGLNDKTGKCSTGKEKYPKATDQKEPEALEKAEIECIQDTGENETLEESTTENESFESAASPPRKDVKKTETATLECDICGKFYGTAASLRTHKWNHTRKGEVSNKITESVKEEEKLIVIHDDIIIDEIERKMDNESILDQTFGDNTELEEKIDQLSERREDGLWVCNRCGKTDKQRFHLRRHVETHIEGFSHSCAVCGKSFTQRAALKAHMWREQHKNQ